MMDEAGHDGRFGAYGGQYVPETLIPALEELTAAYAAAMADPAFTATLDDMLCTYVGRPSLLSEAPHFSAHIGARVLLKREPVLGAFDPAHYVTEYLRAPAADGAQVPVAGSKVSVCSSFDFSPALPLRLSRSSRRNSRIFANPRASSGSNRSKMA